MDTLYSIETSTKEKINKLRKEGMAEQALRQGAGKSEQKRGIFSGLFAWMSRKNATLDDAHANMEAESSRKSASPRYI